MEENRILRLALDLLLVCFTVAITCAIMAVWKDGGFSRLQSTALSAILIAIEVTLLAAVHEMKEIL